MLEESIKELEQEEEERKKEESTAASETTEVRRRSRPSHTPRGVDACCRGPRPWPLSVVLFSHVPSPCHQLPQVRAGDTSPGRRQTGAAGSGILSRAGGVEVRKDEREGPPARQHRADRQSWVLVVSSQAANYRPSLRRRPLGHQASFFHFVMSQPTPPDSPASGIAFGHSPCLPGPTLLGLCAPQCSGELLL